MSVQKVATEVAELEFQRFAEAMDLDLDASRWDEDDRKSFEDTKRRVMRAMESGALIINEKGEPVYTLRDPPAKSAESVTFHEPRGASYMEMDQKKKGHDVAKTHAVMANMTRTSPALFASLANRDYRVCTALMALFLA